VYELADSHSADESSCLGMQLKEGGRCHPRLNSGKRPIANKYREGRMKSTLGGESTAREIVNGEAIGAAKVCVWWVCVQRSVTRPPACSPHTRTHQASDGCAGWTRRVEGWSAQALFSPRDMQHARPRVGVLATVTRGRGTERPVLNTDQGV